MLYDNVKEIANQNGLSIRQIEKELKFSNGSISKWNVSAPSVNKIQKVAQYLEIPIEELLKIKN